MATPLESLLTGFAGEAASAGKTEIPIARRKRLVICMTPKSRGAPEIFRGITRSPVRIQQAQGVIKKVERLRGKNVLITGASSGIGQAIAVRFAREGANVAINYRSGAEQAECTRKMARQARRNAGGKEMLVQADVSEEVQVQAMFAKVIDEFGSLDVLVNN